MDAGIAAMADTASQRQGNPVPGAGCDRTVGRGGAEHRLTGA
jgi:hypothetical protein